MILPLVTLLTLLLSASAQSAQNPYEASLHAIVTLIQSNITTQSTLLTNALNVSQTFSSQPNLQTQVLIQGLSNFRTGLVSMVN